MANLAVDLFENATGDSGKFLSSADFSDFSSYYIDFNGDKKTDFIMQDNQGKVAVFFTNNPSWQNLNSSQLNGRNGFTISKEVSAQ